MQSRLPTCVSGCQRVVLDALPSPVQSQLPTCAAGWQIVVLDTALSPVQSRLLTCAAGVVDAPVSDRSSYSSCNPVLGWGLRNCRLAESCLRAALSPVQSRLLTCAAGVVDAPAIRRTYSRSWGGVYVIAGFTECSRRKLLARADDVRYNNIYHPVR